MSVLIPTTVYGSAGVFLNRYCFTFGRFTKKNEPFYNFLKVRNQCKTKFFESNFEEQSINAFLW